MIRDERGAAMIVILIAMVLVIAMGAAFTLAASTEINLSAKNVHASQAFQTARAGADIGAEYIIANRALDINEDDLNNALRSDDGDKQPGISELEIYQQDDKIIINSTGEHMDMERTVTLELNLKSAFDYSIFATSMTKDSITIKRNFYVNEPAGTNASEINIHSHAEENVEVDYEVGIDEDAFVSIIPEEKFDDDSDGEPGVIAAPAGTPTGQIGTITIDDNHHDTNYYDQVSKHVGELEFDTAGEDLYIRIDEELDIDSMEVIGDGVLHLLIENDLTVKSALRTEGTSKMIIYSKEEIEIKFPGDSEIDAYFFAPKAKFEISGGGNIGKGTFRGGFIVSEFDSPSSDGAELKFDDFFQKYFEAFLDDEKFIATYTRGLWK